MKVLFVCTGNTCRSPMAQAIMQRKAKEQGLDIQADSAAMMMTYGESMNPKAAEALKKLGITGFTHTSRPITQRLADESDLIVTMTWEQRAALATVVDDDKLAAFCEVAPCGDVPDPFGADAEVYEKCARTLDKATDSLISYIKERYLSNK